MLDKLKSRNRRTAENRDFAMAVDRALRTGAVDAHELSDTFGVTLRTVERWRTGVAEPRPKARQRVLRQIGAHSAKPDRLAAQR